MAHDVFVSYSSIDKTIADTIVTSLEKNNIRCWYAPRDIKPSEDWGQAITAAIEESKVFLIIFSGNANQSQHVLDELLYSINEELTILPFRIENLDPRGAMKLHLASRHWLDAYDPSWESHIKVLIKNVASILDTKIEDQQIQLPERVEKAQRQHKKKRTTTILAILAAVLILGTATWFGFNSRFLKPDQNSVDIPPQTPPVTSSPEVTKSDDLPTLEATEEAVETLKRDAILNVAFDSAPNSLDPQISQGWEGFTLVENLFVNLINFDPNTLQFTPEAANSWSIGLDGMSYTFNLRTDIPWVIHPLNGTTEQAIDENNQPSFVSAHDFVYAIHRMCNPNILTTRDYLVPLITGCEEIFYSEDPVNIPVEAYDSIGAIAISDHELLINLTEPAGYFFTYITDLFPVPGWAIEKYGDSWQNPGIIPTNGQYVIDQLVLGESITLIHNDLLPQDMAGGGNIGEIQILVGQSRENMYDLWLTGDLDFSPIPDESRSEHLINYPDKSISLRNPLFTFFDLNKNKKPFNNIHVRRAFAAAIDKAYLVEQYLAGSDQPLNNLALPGSIGAPQQLDDSLEFDPDFAKSELSAGGYPNCEGFPNINLYVATGLIKLPEKVVRDWESALGCPANTITINPINLGLDQTDMILWGWGSSEPSDQRGVYTILYCENTGGYNFRRECDDNDDLIIRAEQEINIGERTAIYQQLEENFFSSEGEFPVIPLFLKYEDAAIQNWLSIDHLSKFVHKYYQWTIDMDLKGQ